jgi:hypothetical protein
MKSKRVLCEVRTASVYIMVKCMAVQRHYDGYWGLTEVGSCDMPEHVGDKLTSREYIL